LDSRVGHPLSLTIFATNQLFAKGVMVLYYSTFVKLCLSWYQDVIKALSVF
jgi:hypothetical protein